MVSNQTFLTKQQIASILCISTKTLYRRLKKHKIPYDGELIPYEKAKSIMDILTKLPLRAGDANNDINC